MTIKIIPTCRYGHGELHHVTGKGTNPMWGVVSARPNIAFFANLYECLQCGYIEMFDTDVETTKLDEGLK